MNEAAANRQYAGSLARAFGGAIIFGLPLLMTMEMWALGHFVSSPRLILFIAATLFVLVMLSRYGGFEPTEHIGEDILDALAAYAVGVICAAAILGLLGLLTESLSFKNMAGMIAIESTATSFGAMITRKQLSGQDGGNGQEEEEEEEEEARAAGYGAQLFLMAAGALFFAFNIAPTEEVVLIALRITPWHGLALIALSLGVLHALVFAVGLAGQEERPDGYGAARVVLAFTIPGYGIAVLVSLYVLWTFGSIDHSDPAALAISAVVLGFPASIGAAIARLVV